jgi:hypothetical protein
MLHEDGVIARDRVEVVAREAAALGGLGVVVLEADDPVARRRARGPLAQRALDRGDRPQVAIDLLEVSVARVGRMRVGVDEAGHHRLAVEVGLPRTRRDQIQDVIVAPDREQPIAGDRQGLCGGLGGVHREDVPVVEDRVRLSARGRQQRERSERSQERAPAQWGHIWASLFGHLTVDGGGSFGPRRPTGAPPFARA